MIVRSRVLVAVAVQAGFLPVAAGRSVAQQVGPDTTGRLRAARQVVERLGQDHPEIWPGFRPDTIPVIYVIKNRGALLLGWHGALPDGYGPLADAPDAGWQSLGARGAASTGIRVEGRGVAQVVYGGQQVAWVVGTTMHEAFHVFEGARAREGRRFGRGENSFLVTRYPVFDVGNETAFALEGKLLAAALDAASDSAAIQLASEFLAVRESRQRTLGAELAEFEQQAELNEGLAQYVDVKALRALAVSPEVAWRREAAAEAGRQLGDLGGFLQEQTISFRLRYYSTGAAQALLLDRLARQDWKTRIMEQDLTLQDALGLAIGYRERETALRRSAQKAFGAESLARQAEAATRALKASLRARVDSALSRPGVTLVVETEAIGGAGLCGIDPQNLLQVDVGVLFHARWVRPCAGAGLQAEFTTPVLQDRRAGSFRAVIGPADSVRLTVNGRRLDLAGTLDIAEAKQVRLDAPDATLTSALAAVRLEQGVLRIRPLAR